MKNKPEEGIATYITDKGAYCANCGMRIVFNDPEWFDIHFNFHKQLRGKYLVKPSSDEE